MIVMKFGGTSVGDADRIRRVAELAQAQRGRGALVVLSAMGKTTNALFRAAQLAQSGNLAGALEAHANLLAVHEAVALDLFPAGVPAALEDAMSALSEELTLLLRGVALLRELTPRSMDAIASIGERLSTRITAAFMDVPWVDARSVMRTDDAFGTARPQPDEIRPLAQRHLAPLFTPGGIAVTQGYIGATAEGLTTTLGRGGSDYSASLFGAALGAEEIQIWTDVEGVLTCDPRVVPTAQPIAELSFAEAAELAAFGAKVLHPATIEPAVAAAIPVTVRDTMRPQGRYTTITAGGQKEGRAATALASRGPITVITIDSAQMLNQSGFLAEIFDVFRSLNVSVDLVATAEVSVSLTVEPSAPIAELTRRLSNLAKVDVSPDRALIAVVGERLKPTPGVAARVFGALRDVNVELISMGANDVNLSIVVRHADVEEGLRRLHAALFEGS